MTNGVDNSNYTTPASSGSAASTPRPLGVLVGYDGSDHATRALHWGARAAQRKGLPLTVVTAFTISPLVAGYVDAPTIAAEESLAHQGAERSQEGARQYLEDYPGEVTYRIEYGDAAGVLIGLSAEAELVVIGSRGRGGFMGMILGSVASSVPPHSKCPSVVVRPSYDPDASAAGSRFAPVEDSRPVTVGVDGSEECRSAVLAAADAAAARDTSLRMVMAMPPLDGALLWYPELAPRDQTFAERHRKHLESKLKDEVAWLQERVAGIRVEPEVVEGNAAEVMTRETDNAQLTVLGTRGRGGLASTLLGSVCRGVLMNAGGRSWWYRSLKAPSPTGTDRQRTVK